MLAGLLGAVFNKTCELFQLAKPAKNQNAGRILECVLSVGVTKAMSFILALPFVGGHCMDAPRPWIEVRNWFIMRTC